MRTKIGMGFCIGKKPLNRAILDASYKFRQRIGHWPEWIEVHPSRVTEARESAGPLVDIKGSRYVSPEYVFLWRGEE